jgi:hypothetical protein
MAAAPFATVKQSLTVEPVSNRYKLADNCFVCGALPGDQCEDPWGKLPWIVTKRDSGGWRFLIDGRDPDNRDVFSGYYLSTEGKVGSVRYNFHRSHFLEELPA